MTTAVELERIVERAIPMVGATDVVAVVVGTPCGKLSNGAPSGVGGTTRFGAAWFDGLRKSEPIALFDQQRDAKALIDLLTGRALRSAPRSVAAVTALGGSAERGAVPSARSQRRSSARSRTLADGTRQLNGVHRFDDAGSPGALPTPRPAGQGSTVAPTPVEKHPSHTGGAATDPGLPPEAPVTASPEPRACKACGADLSALPPSRTGQRRTTCDDACRQAYHRGQRAPLPGVVDSETLGRLSRLSRPTQTAPADGDRTPPSDGGSQLALGAPA